ncbi:MAG: phospholipase D-like domain-containing protein, partial [Oscillospiraceae bacterium]|nr:phospholipase D-like domain-containing protein [Oscillospiraceae bacterium]
MYRWYGERSIHAKTVLVDDTVSVIGSYNLDMRSTYLDTELMLVIESPALNAQLRETLEQTERESLLITPDGQEIPGPACTPQSLSAARKA